MITATLKNYRQSPRKVRLVADEVRGKKVGDALIQLSFIPNRAALPIKKLVESAIANAKHNYDVDVNGLFIKSITVDSGFTMKRWIPKWRGTAHPIRKKASHIKIILDQYENKKEGESTKTQITNNKLKAKR
jgi:large subunit ribosomal protein L22